MPPVGFEPTISAGERPKTYAFYSTATGTDLSCLWAVEIYCIGSLHPPRIRLLSFPIGLACIALSPEVLRFRRAEPFLKSCHSACKEIPSPLFVIVFGNLSFLWIHAFCKSPLSNSVYVPWCACDGYDFAQTCDCASWSGRHHYCTATNDSPPACGKNFFSFQQLIKERVGDKRRGTHHWLEGGFGSLPSSDATGSVWC